MIKTIVLNRHHHLFLSYFLCTITLRSDVQVSLSKLISTLFAHTIRPKKKKNILSSNPLLLQLPLPLLLHFLLQSIDFLLPFPIPIPTEMTLPLPKFRVIRLRRSFVLSNHSPDHIDKPRDAKEPDYETHGPTVEKVSPVSHSHDDDGRDGFLLIVLGSKRLCGIRSRLSFVWLRGKKPESFPEFQWISFMHFFPPCGRISF
ncbi:hypothetical protein QBC38DRAFT_35998 [Podospora fimiseda]|uniref:Uncharacterized protein n=1 Tax=Podospora fimiseda TaxID=252190 RepID=A0AAN7BIB8_9PEZI|nr:hypothetical protein QBC38DRAFT_35998 [Podospora fimiseda]